MRLTFTFIVALASLAGSIAAADDDLVFLQNEHLRVGVKKSSGGGIAWISTADSDRNLIDHYDRGRLVQQSYYGDADDSRWDKQPWRYNPVQGGDWRGSGARLLKFEADKARLYAQTLPKHWASGEDLDECRMEQTIDLEGELVRVKYRFTYSGQQKHAVRDQEVPAFFVAPQYGTLVVYEGAKPWTEDKVSRSTPGWPNESRKLSEPWAAYVDKHDQGIGAYVPVATGLTCYRFGNGDPKQGACSYFAPLVKFAIEPGLVWEYEVFITLGSSEQIRNRFAALHRMREERR